MNRDEMADKFVEANTHGWESCAVTGVVLKNRKVKVSRNTFCHAGLNQQSDCGHNIDMVVSLIMREHLHKRIDEKYAVPYLDWLMNRSPYASTFLSKDAQDCVDKERVYSDPTTPFNLMVGGLVASRRVTEYGYVCRAWYELVQRGVNENFAYVVAHNIHLDRIEYHRKNGTNLSLSSTVGHTSLDVDCMDLSNTINFVDNNPLYLVGCMCDGGSYRGVDKTWGHLDQTDYINNMLQNLVADINKAKGKTLNPFPAVHNNGRKSYPCDDAFDCIAEGLIKHFEKEYK